ncbi:MAG: tetratricopeptide repeat protein [Casimicrobiaceae bacterium]
MTRGPSDLAQAAAVLERTLAADPVHAGALQDYAMLALEAGRPQVALGIAARWAGVAPRSALAKNVQGIASRQCGRLADAIAHLKGAVSLDPDFFDARVNLGNALVDAGEAKAALPHYRHALALDPSSASVHNNLGNLHRELRQPAAALAEYRRALELDPRHERARSNLGNILKDLGDTDGAIDAFRASLAAVPNRPEVWSNLLLTLNMSDRLDAAKVADEHSEFGQHFARLLTPLPPRAPSNSARRLRVGYVSADFRKHAVATFFLPLLAAHDRSSVEVFCYYNQPRGDEVTTRIQSLAEHFLPVAGMPDRALAERIRQDGIDVLVDLNGHTAGNRLPLFFLRPAPVQATWLGYLGATGVPTIDWRITDARFDPGDDALRSGREAPWRLPRTMWCYAPYAEAPAVAPLPSAASGVVTFGCLNNTGKVSPSVLDAWMDILRSVPDSRMLLMTSPEAGRIDLLHRKFAAAGIAPARVDLVARSPLADYLGRYARIDIALDTWPYAGGTTTCDALWMGVPVVSLAADRPFGRSGASILGAIGHDELVASSSEEYVAVACALAADRDRLLGLRVGLREQMASSPLTDASGFARDFEAALVGMRDAASPRVPP